MRGKERQLVKTRPVIGLALGGGGARGYAHLGVLKALHQANIPVAVIAGTSMGAVVGAAYAAGYSIDQLLDMALEINWRRLFSFFADITLPRQGVIAGNRLEEYFGTLTNGKTFDQLDVALTVVATDIVTGEEVRLSSGPVAKAVRASIAIPGVFCPVKVGGRLLVDGSIAAPVPVPAAFEAGATAVLAIDVCSSVDRSDVLINAWKWFKAVRARRTLQAVGISDVWRFLKPALPQCVSIVDRSLELCDRYPATIPLLASPGRYWQVRPAVDNVRWYEFHRAEECIRAGEAVGQQVAAEISSLLNRGE
ncbi:MAG: patatin-like phospholipase family protein [Desulfofundulus sp.]